MKFKKIIFLLAFTVFYSIASPVSLAVAMIPIDKSSNDIVFYDKNSCNVENAVNLNSVSPGSGEPNGLTYPNLDAQKMADAIEKFIEENAPTSPLKGTSTVAVASAKEANISPFLAYAHALMESSLATTTVAGAQVKLNEGHNSFGRTATSSQPHVVEGHDENGNPMIWYKWSSFEASLDSSAAENKSRDSGDWFSYDRSVFSEEIDQGLSAYAEKYAPPSQNDTQAYINNMQGFLDKMAEYATGSAVTSTPSASTSGAASSCCSSASSGGSMVTPLSDNAETALSYLMSVGTGQKLNLAQAAGIVGNLQVESGDNIDPNATNGTHTGIAQWDNGGRWGGSNGVVSFARDIGGDPKSFETQIRFLAWEMGLNNEWQGHAATQAATLPAVLATSTPVDAAAAFEETFERSGGSALDKRQENAQKIYDKYADSTSITSVSGVSAAGSAAACSGGSGGATGLQKYTLMYAWPESGHGVDKKPEYATAVKQAVSEGRYVGGPPEGVDCGGFVTTLIYDSGFDKTYNFNASVSGGAGNTGKQRDWLEKNWQTLGVAGGKFEPDGSTFTSDKLQPGDVAHSPGHTWIYVGDIEGFPSKYASASLGDYAPKIGNEGFDYNSPTWFRKKNLIHV